MGDRLCDGLKEKLEDAVALGDKLGLLVVHGDEETKMVKVEVGVIVGINVAEAQNEEDDEGERDRVTLVV